ncbi:MAG: type III-B CRISPR module-associated protein Cmr3 [Acidobacteria bacterium]|nr:type III-B CRISPR module-associated protein Cmr3 [Acidobacteriota bacterium]
MKTWIIEPRDPLIVRDGRPFENTPGARARSLDFPFPSTTTGVVRTRNGFAKNYNFNCQSNDHTEIERVQKLIEEVKQLEVCGPLLVELTSSGEIDRWLMPAPADALMFEDGNEPASKENADLRQLVPLRMPDGATTNLASDLCPVGLAARDPRKPFGYAPRYWRECEFLRWLTNPHTQPVQVSELGHSGPTQELRTHVGIQPDSQTSVEGALYQTRGLEFSRAVADSTSRRLRLGLAVLTEASLSEGLAPLGGERRLAYWRESNKTLPACPSELREAIKKTKACRVILLTPAHFQAGYRPEWLLQLHKGATAELKAVAVNRPQVVSGWDFDRTKSKHGQPKPTRRLAPAGSVFFLKLTGGQDEISNWVDAMWMHCVSDDRIDGEAIDQDRRDGFGLAALGVWSGNCEPMDVS